MYRFILFWALLVLIAAPALAADTNKYPATLVDVTCTDTEDTPAAVTPGLTHFHKYNPKPAVQLTGSADGFCDNDSRIVATVATAITADATFGPFNGRGVKGIFLYVDGDAVTGGDTKYHMALAGQKPHDGAVIELDYTGFATGNGVVVYTIGTTIGTPNGDTEGLEVQIPNVFYILLDLNTADSWQGDISILPWFE